MSDPTIRYPAGPITPAGAYHILHDRIPQVALQSWDDTAVFNMMGGSAIHDPTLPERVNIVNLSGLIPPWQSIRQKGATQDGSSFIDALYDEMQVKLDVIAKGRNPAYTRKVVNHLLASIDAKQNSELSWMTHEMGRWWAPVRMDKTMDDQISVATNRQKISLRLVADDAFWRSYDHVDSFEFQYEDLTDTFNFVDAAALGPNWTLAYTGTGGNLSANGDQAVWVSSGTLQRTVVARRNSFTTATSNQVISIVFGSFQKETYTDKSYNDIWARLKTTGTAGDEGVRLRVGHHEIILSYFVGGVETIMRRLGIFNIKTWIPPYPGEKYTLIAGEEGDSRTFKVLRNKAVIMTVKETGTGSVITNRGIGFGMEAGGGLGHQAVPAAVRKISAGDNSTVSQSGFLERVNAGDQGLWDRLTCFGPGMFRFGNGPDSPDTIEFGPLLPNQIMYLRTDPRKRAVDDLTVIPPTPQELTKHQQRMKDYDSFAFANNVPPLRLAMESKRGILPPQGNPYSMLKGRWSNPIPPKPAGKPAIKYHVTVSIDDGNASSQVIAAGTPLRRNPY